MRKATSRLLLTIALARAAGFAVQTLSSKNFETTVVPEELWLVKFYAPWCGHCKRLAPILEAIANDTETLGKAKIGKVDCTVEKALCTKFDVHGFPSLKIMEGGQVWDHKGHRSKEGVTDLIARMQRPAVRLLTTVVELHEALSVASASGIALFVLGGGEPADPLRTSFEQAARTLQHRDLFVRTEAPEVVRALFEEVSEPNAAPTMPFIARLEAGEDPRLLPAPKASDAVIDPADVVSFVESSRLPIFNLATFANFYDLSTAGRPLVLLVQDPAKLGVDALTLADSAVPGPAADLRSLARDDTLRGRFVFAMLDYVGHEEHINSTYFITRESTPRLLVLRKTDGNRAFATDDPGEALSLKGIRGFLDRVHSNAIHFEYEGTWGLPDRNWRKVTRLLPALTKLDFVPQYTFSFLIAIIILFAVWKLLAIGADHEEHTYEPPGPPAARQPTKKLD